MVPLPPFRSHQPFGDRDFPRRTISAPPCLITSFATLALAPKKDTEKSDRKFEAVKDTSNTAAFAPATICAISDLQFQKEFIPITDLPGLKDYCIRLRANNTLFFENRMNLFKPRFEEMEQGDQTIYGLELNHPNRRPEYKIYIQISIETGETKFSNGVVTANDVYHLEAFEMENGKYEENMPVLELRFTTDGNHGEILHIDNALQGVYDAIEPLFSGQWCIKDNAKIEGETKNGVKFHFYSRFCVLWDWRDASYQKSLGYQEVAEIDKLHNPKVYQDALSTLRLYNISLVWSFMKTYPNAHILRNICNMAFGATKEVNMTSCEKTLQQLFAVVLNFSLENQAYLHSILFTPPASYKEMGGTTIQAVYWRLVGVLARTQVFEKNLSKL